MPYAIFITNNIHFQSLTIDRKVSYYESGKGKFNQTMVKRFENWLGQSLRRKWNLPE